MKVYIGPYKSRWICNVHGNYMHKRYGYNWPEYESKGLINKVEPFKEYFLERLEDTLQWIYDHSINLYLDRRGRKVKIRIDTYDTWSMDDTLAPIILPMLKQLKDTKHGAPYVDPHDCPKDLCPKEKDEYGTDDTHFKRWDWVLDEMIWAFEQKNRDHWEDDYYGPYIEDQKNGPMAGSFEWIDDKGRLEHQKRMSNGFKLFGKYYEGLWD